MSYRHLIRYSTLLEHKINSHNIYKWVTLYSGKFSRGSIIIIIYVHVHCTIILISLVYMDNSLSAKIAEIGPPEKFPTVRNYYPRR